MQPTVRELEGADSRMSPHDGTSPVDRSLNGWLPWSDAGTPATTRQEFRFVEDLEHLSGGHTDQHRRSDVTAVLNALRSGFTVGDLLERAPGLRPQRLHSAYRTLAVARAAAEAAWMSICAARTIDAFEAHADRAALLLPVPVIRLDRIVAELPERYEESLERTVARIEATSRAILEIEAALDREYRGTALAVTLGHQLRDTDGLGLFDQTDHLPQRVGALDSLRVSQLLGERRPAR